MGLVEGLKESSNSSAIDTPLCAAILVNKRGFLWAVEGLPFAYVCSTNLLTNLGYVPIDDRPVSSVPSRWIIPDWYVMPSISKRCPREWNVKR